MKREGEGREGRGGEERGGDEGGGEGSLHTVGHTQGSAPTSPQSRVVSVNHEDLNADIHTVELHEAHLPRPPPTSPDLPRPPPDFPPTSP